LAEEDKANERPKQRSANARQKSAGHVYQFSVIQNGFQHNCLSFTLDPVRKQAFQETKMYIKTNCISMLINADIDI
jgi:hypothetical protein